jgi:hypothetical protein
MIMDLTGRDTSYRRMRPCSARSARAPYFLAIGDRGPQLCVLQFYSYAPWGVRLRESACNSVKSVGVPLCLRGGRKLFNTIAGACFVVFRRFDFQDRDFRRLILISRLRGVGQLLGIVSVQARPQYVFLCPALSPALQTLRTHFLSLKLC